MDSPVIWYKTFSAYSNLVLCHWLPFNRSLPCLGQALRGTFKWIGLMFWLRQLQYCRQRFQEVHDLAAWQQIPAGTRTLCIGFSWFSQTWNVYRSVALRSTIT